MNTTSVQCLGFIMDGNRRFAKEQGLPTYEGHKQGGEVLRDCVEWLREKQIAHGVFYAFSTENWNRSDEEVGYLMSLFRDWLKKLEQDTENKNIKVRIVGRRKDFAEDIAEQMNRLEKRTEDLADPDTTIWVALSYGGRDEIVEAVNLAVQQKVVVTEDSFEALLATSDLPDPDMIVRTSGEQRLSNFLTWKSTYSELYFIEKHWPALTRDDFDDILVEYEKRNRRRGR